MDEARRNQSAHERLGVSTTIRPRANSQDASLRGWQRARPFPPKVNLASAARGLQDVSHSARPRSTPGCRGGISRAFEPLTFRDANPVEIDQDSRGTFQATQQLLSGDPVAFRGLKQSDLAISPQDSDRLTALRLPYVAADPIPEFADFDSSHPQEHSQVT